MKLNAMDKLNKQKYLDGLWAVEKISQGHFDTALLSVSSGAIALSVTVVIRDAVLICTALIAIAWVFWLLSIFLQLSSHLASISGVRRQIFIVQEDCTDENKWVGIPTLINR